MNHRTILYEEHVRLGARIVDFHGWDLPVQYESILAEHTHCRQAACVFDTSHMGKILIRTRPSRPRPRDHAGRRGPPDRPRQVRLPAQRGRAASSTTRS